MKLFIRILRRAAAIVNGLVVLAILAALVPAVCLRAAREWQNTDTPSFAGYAAAVAQDAETSSGLAAGSLVLLKKAQEYAVGDRVACRDGGETVFGAVFTNKDGRILLYDTAAKRVRPGSIPAEQVLGVIHNVLPGVGGWLDKAASNTGLLALVGAGVLLVELPAFLRPRKKGEEEAEEDEDEDEDEEE